MRDIFQEYTVRFFKASCPHLDFCFYCTGDWIYRNGHYYSFQGKSSANSWFAAEGFCREQGEDVHLASIHSEDENEFIKSLASSGEEQWIGLTNHNIRPKVFEWMDRSKEYGDFLGWDDGEPNCATVDEDCVAMKPDGKWIDVACRKQRLESDTPFDRRAFTCKTSGKNRHFLGMQLSRKLMLKSHIGLHIT